MNHHRAHHGTFGNDRVGVLAERFARAFGTPQFIIGQTVIVALWIAANAVAFGLRWDPYPFILLNLAFSTQAAYAAPLILRAQTGGGAAPPPWGPRTAAARDPRPLPRG